MEKVFPCLLSERNLTTFTIEISLPAHSNAELVHCRTFFVPVKDSLSFHSSYVKDTKYTVERALLENLFIFATHHVKNSDNCMTHTDTTSSQLLVTVTILLLKYQYLRRSHCLFTNILLLFVLLTYLLSK